MPDYIFESSWEVCNKVGGIYTVLSTRAKTLQEALHDKIIFIGPDLAEANNLYFNEDKTLIRANQGHSIPVDVELPEKKPPRILYHGTGEKFVNSIDRQGLLPRGRLYVHLSPDEATAKIVGARHGKPVIYQVLAGEMADQGFTFYQSVNGVWLTKKVPAEFLRKIRSE